MNILWWSLDKKKWICKIKDCKIIKFFILRNATRSFVVIFVDQTEDYFVRFHICFLTPDLHKDKEKNLKRNQSKGLVRSNCKIFYPRFFLSVYYQHSLFCVLSVSSLVSEGFGDSCFFSLLICICLPACLPLLAPS